MGKGGEKKTVKEDLFSSTKLAASYPKQELKFWPLVRKTKIKYYRAKEIF